VLAICSREWLKGIGSPNLTWYRLFSAGLWCMVIWLAVRGGCHPNPGFIDHNALIERSLYWPLLQLRVLLMGSAADADIALMIQDGADHVMFSAV